MESFLLLLLLLLVIITLLHGSSYAENIVCSSSSSCGSISNITYPFQLTTDPLSCGDFRYNLSCENNNTVLNFLVHENKYQRYYVRAINYNNYTIRVIDPNFRKLNETYTSFTNNTLSIGDFNLYDSYATIIYLESKNQNPFEEKSKQIAKTIVLISCERVVRNSSYIDANPCILSNNNDSFTWSYYLLDTDKMSPSELEESCWIKQVTLIDDTSFHGAKPSCYDINKQLAQGFQLSWIQSFDKTEVGGVRQICRLNQNSNKVRCSYYSECLFKEIFKPNESLDKCDNSFEIFMSKFIFYTKYYIYYMGTYKYIVGLLTPRTFCGFIFVIFLVVYKWRRRHLSMYNGIEDFLHSYNNLMPIRYSYRDIRKMTNNFKEKLGEGGFGTVYKGQLCSGPFVAVKMFGKSKINNDQDFINEVATTGKIHHVNIVRLIGFCVDGTRRALIYDFMSNGSLDKYIFSQETTNVSLSVTRVFEISLGIARGIEYLHRGCDMPILHFDIKPHNILLDENFIPKVSDFGLARSFSLDNSVASLSAARGTMGYIAPELFYKNIGRVSSKSDVYSFGMLLMEMANRQKNASGNTENSSHIYFPLLIHKQLNEGKEIKIDEHATKEEVETMKKMAIVALWCIQLRPCDRPTMSQVIEMLQSKFNCLEIPPNLLLYPQEQESNNSVETSFSLTSCEEDSAY
ncbi:rust resistance kinase Lr10 [Cannabis sativa]|uniref:rust resistance kinase Lr10 n=1 Tax=Cannabis sativa TaxID=3483 RepID=UPI0011DF0509|nr:rust resistance kinase Lr10 [Cannabis sativa]